ncbi:sugar phosphate isomerase/epimerase [Micromonospora sp. WMMA1363]|uniref:sugar phosphate isomerase/epimerase family protein n=1 Tax=Micromonospora sp. WMMA1363 TaxID=3053985 RepID=UPI00259CF821|nr:sugar phosphate isomerase/epimerase [Micromonospora sp. WMMA1363]MDM4721890.1 sugar phosphate isomerase/epimerase [Micromonospora sp. WMMA1363]
MSSNSSANRIRTGSCPDSWGVWYPDDPQQTPWPRFLDEVARAGYEWIEIGPYGYLPTDPARLADETAAHGLRVTAATVFSSVHRGRDGWEETWPRVVKNASLARALGGSHLVVVPAFWRDEKTGALLEEPSLTAAQWRDLTSLTERLARQVRDSFGLRLVVHPHVYTHINSDEVVTRFLDATDPDLVSLCLDIGHYTYFGGDSVSLIETYGPRIGYLHLKQVDPAVLAEVTAEDAPFGSAVARGVMCEPPDGVPSLERVLAAAQRLDTDLFAIVEQDMYPCPADKPFPIAERTRRLLRSYGV